jgi:hypothetical protein
MIEETIGRIRARLGAVESLSDERRRELQQLLATLESEVDALSRTHTEQAESIAGFVQVSAHEATRDTPDPRLLKLSLQGLASSVEGFESTHPKLVRVVDSVCQTLANLGM